jgi:hypothetical protein
VNMSSQAALRFVELAGSTADLTVTNLPGWDECPGAAVWVEDGGQGAGALEVELTARQQGGGIAVGKIVVCSADSAASFLPSSSQLPRTRLICTAAVPGTQAWTAVARAQGDPGCWRVGLGIGRAPAGDLFERGPIWAERGQAGVGPVVLGALPGERWLGVTVVAGPLGATVQLPWSPIITVPSGDTFQLRYDAASAPIRPLQGTWFTVLGGDVASWLHLSGF